MDLLFDMQARLGTTLLLITHDPALASRCGTLLRMKDGRIESQARVPA
jgi:putative ABC transport system ATP-binding protein